jgi:hypothetical protein
MSVNILECDWLNLQLFSTHTENENVAVTWPQQPRGPERHSLKEREGAGDLDTIGSKPHYDNPSSKKEHLI